MEYIINLPKNIIKSYGSKKMLEGVRYKNLIYFTLKASKNKKIEFDSYTLFVVGRFEEEEETIKVICFSDESEGGFFEDGGLKGKIRPTIKTAAEFIEEAYKVKVDYRINISSKELAIERCREAIKDLEIKLWDEYAKLADINVKIDRLKNIQSNYEGNIKALKQDLKKFRDEQKAIEQRFK